ncbi:MAG: copper chaperone PCu(A)C [Mariprofundales bacterium]|nr:copper chaperone PCu(A)C [Mariprofundales bacterium]
MSRTINFARMGLMIAAVLACAAPSWAGRWSIEDAWIPLPPPVSDVAAAYLTLRNSGDRPVTIISVTTKFAKHAMIHTMRMEHGMMKMMALPKLVIRAHGSVVLRRGGKHIMLMGPTRTLHAGDRVRLTLHDQSGAAVTTQATVRDMRK